MCDRLPGGCNATQAESRFRHSRPAAESLSMGRGAIEEPRERLRIRCFSLQVVMPGVYSEP
jgi:hypothetical protein